MTSMIEKHGLSVAETLVRFVEDLALPDTKLDPTTFWRGVAEIYDRFAPRNEALLIVRNEMQAKIDAWHEERASAPLDMAAYQAFLRDIGYLLPEPPSFTVSPENVDDEVARLAGPQLVVPVLNARFLLNAANARWGSLYDALYGTDALQRKQPGQGYDAAHGVAVIAWVMTFLDRIAPLIDTSWSDWSGGTLPLAEPSQLVGQSGPNILLRHNGLHIEIVIDPGHPIGKTHPAGIADVMMESALSAIVDLEDSVAAVDAEDKVAAYTNWLGVMKGDLQATFSKSGVSTTRTLQPDRLYTAVDGSEFRLPGRSLLFVRNVGHLMTTPAILLPDGREAPEGILDGIVTSLIAIHDLNRDGEFRNSRTGSIYIVKPKMHGPDEAEFTNDLFDAIEDILALGRHTIKVGLMDEERRTSANLAACIHAVKDRIVFINTGFLDRTGDEIHTSMQAGAMIRKGDMKNASWIKAYEDRNVQIGLACGLSGKGQIGKGMWAAPDRMADMLEQKIAHPMTGASTAWVPSPTAATLHATHYHLINVFARQEERKHETVATLDALLAIPIVAEPAWGLEEVREELDNNAQGLLGYVVRWIDQGIGCSKVPDIHDIGLMEDRATLRISSQHIANWLLHGVASNADVEAALQRMAVKVDTQNGADPLYRPMNGAEETSFAYRAAHALVFEGLAQPSGYTEPLLHRYRAEAKRDPKAM